MDKKHIEINDIMHFILDEEKLNEMTLMFRVEKKS